MENTRDVVLERLRREGDGGSWAKARWSVVLGRGCGDIRFVLDGDACGLK